MKYGFKTLLAEWRKKTDSTPVYRSFNFGHSICIINSIINPFYPYNLVKISYFFQYNGLMTGHFYSPNRRVLIICGSRGKTGVPSEKS